jgi:acetoin utilization protein AcuB
MPQILDDIMTRHVVTVSPDDTLATIRSIFDRFHFHHILVVEQDRMIGIISDRDLLKHLSPFVGRLAERTQDLASLKQKAHQIMCRHVTTARPETPIGDALLLLIQRRISCLPVLDDQGRCAGIVTTRDLLRWCTRCATGSCAA